MSRMTTGGSRARRNSASGCARRSCPSRGRPQARSGSGSPPAACAGRTCTSPRGTWRRDAHGRFRGTRSSGGWTRWARRPSGSPSGIASGSPGCGTPAGAAAGAARVRRTSVRTRPSRAGTPTAGSPSSPSSPRPTPTGSQTASTPPSPRRCSAPGSSATARCAGALPPGGRLGIYGFGASAHIVAQVAIAQGATVHVLTRSGAGAASWRTSLGAASVGHAADAPPEPLDAAILFAPAGRTGAPPRCGRWTAGECWSSPASTCRTSPRCATSEELFLEKEVRSVTANTRADGEEFLRLAQALGIRPTVQRRPLSTARRTLEDLARDAYAGAAVLPDLPEDAGRANPDRTGER